MTIYSMAKASGLCSILLCQLACAGQAKDPQVHIDKAYALAGDTYLRKTVDLQCTETVNAMNFFKNSQPLAPAKVFDNLYFLGVSSVSAWAITTSDGIILIDALNNSEQAQQIIETGLVDLGLDPAQIKTIVITHGHGDHYGGARYLADKYGARVLMSEKDWALATNPPPPPKIPGLAPPKWSTAPDKDLVALDGDTIDLGDTSVKIVLTPGHTPGTLSLVFPVFNNGTAHTAALWGGTGFPRDLKGVQDYVSSTDKFIDILRDRQVDVALSNHPFVDESQARLAQLKQTPGQHPFVIGTDAVQRFASILSECAKATLAKRSGAQKKTAN